MPPNSDSDTSSSSTEEVQFISKQPHGEKQKVKNSNERKVAERTSKSHQNNSRETSNKSFSQITAKNSSHVTNNRKKARSPIQTVPISSTSDSESDSSDFSDGGKIHKKTKTVTLPKGKVSNSVHTSTGNARSKLKTTAASQPVNHFKGVLKTRYNNDSDSSESVMPGNQEQFKRMSNRRKSIDSEVSFANVMSSTKILKGAQCSYADSDNEQKHQKQVILKHSPSKVLMNAQQIKKEEISSSCSDSSDLERKPIKQESSKSLEMFSQNSTKTKSESESKSSSDEDSKRPLTKNVNSKVDLNKIKTGNVRNKPGTSYSQTSGSALGTVPVKSDSESRSSSDEDSKPPVTKNVNSKVDLNKIRTGNIRNKPGTSYSQTSGSALGTVPGKKEIKDTSPAAIKKQIQSSESDSSSEEERKVNIKKNVVSNTSNKLISSNSRASFISTKSRTDSDSESDVNAKNVIKVKKERRSSSSESKSALKQNAFISQNKFGHANFAQNIFKQTTSRGTSDETDSETERKPEIAPIADNKQKRRDTLSPSDSDAEHNNTVRKSLTKLLDKKNVPNRKSEIQNMNVSGEAKIENICTSLCLEDLTQNEEVWMMQCPKELNPELLVGQTLKLEKDSKRKLKLGGHKYECVSKYSEASNICMVASQSATNNNLALKIIQPVGNIVIHQMLREKSPEHLISPEKTKIAPPKNLKVRHPIFGSNFEDKLTLDKSVEEKLNDAELNCSRVDEKIKKKHKKSKIKQKKDQGSDEIIFELLSQTKTSLQLPLEDNINMEDLFSQTKMKSEKLWNEDDGKLKKKNRKSIDENLGTCRDTVIADILKSSRHDLNMREEHANKKYKKLKQETNKPNCEQHVDIVGENIFHNLHQRTETKHKKKKKNKEYHEVKTEKIKNEIILSDTNKDLSEGISDKKHKKKHKKESDIIKTEIGDYSAIETLLFNANKSTQDRPKKHKNKQKLINEVVVNIKDIKEEVIDDGEDKIPKKKKKKSHKSEIISQEDSAYGDSQASIFSDSTKQHSSEERAVRKRKKQKKKDISGDDVFNLGNIKQEIKVERIEPSSVEEEVTQKKKHKKNRHREDENEHHLKPTEIGSLSQGIIKKKKFKGDNEETGDSENHKKRKKRKVENLQLIT